MQLTERLKTLCNEMSAAKDTEQENTKNANDFIRGMATGKTSAYLHCYQTLVRFVAEHSCSKCEKLIENDADCIDGFCEKCAKEARNVHIDG